MATLYLPLSVARAITEHADREAPKECCGLLAGRERRVERSYPLANVSPRPELRYFAEPAGLVRALRAIRDRGDELLAIYHSHPRSDPIPSPTDLAESYYPECVYLIIGPRDAAPRLRAFLLAEARVEPVSLHYEGEA